MTLHPLSKVLADHADAIAATEQFETQRQAACAHSGLRCCGCNWATCHTLGVTGYDPRNDYADILEYLSAARRLDERAAAARGEYCSYLREQADELRSSAWMTAHNPGPVNAGVNFFS